jgi:hypothetical protein
MKLQINFLILISFIWTSSIEMFTLPGKFEFKLSNVLYISFYFVVCFIINLFQQNKG